MSASRVARRTPAGEEGRRRGQPALDRGPVDGVLGVGQRLEHQGVPPRLVGGGGVGGLVGPGQVGDLGGDVPAGGRGRRAPARARGGRRPAPRAARPRRRGRRGPGRGRRSRQRAPSSVRAHWSRIRVRRRESSVMVAARPSPRTRSRVAWTSCRTPGWDSSAPSRRTVIRWVSRPILCSRGATADSSVVVGARRDPELEGRHEDRRDEVVAEHPQHVAGAVGPVGQAGGRGRELGAADLGQVLDGRDHQVVLGREVVQLGSPRHPRALADQRRRRPREPVLHQALDRGVHQPRTHRARPLLLRHPGGCHHPPMLPSYKQTVKPVFLWGGDRAADA